MRTSATLRKEGSRKWRGGRGQLRRSDACFPPTERESSADVPSGVIILKAEQNYGSATVTLLHDLMGGMLT